MGGGDIESRAEQQDVSADGPCTSLALSGLARHQPISRSCRGGCSTSNYLE